MVVTTAKAGPAPAARPPCFQLRDVGRLLGISELEFAQLTHGVRAGPPPGVLEKANAALGLEMAKQHGVKERQRWGVANTWAVSPCRGDDHL